MRFLGRGGSVLDRRALRCVADAFGALLIRIERGLSLLSTL